MNRIQKVQFYCPKCEFTDKKVQNFDNINAKDHRSLFVGYLSQEFIREHFGIDINYIQLPCESLSEKLDKGLKEVKIEDDKKNKLWESMKESMTDAFKLHGTGYDKR